MTMKPIIQCVILTLLLSPSFYSFSHPGHEHSHWTSDFLHTAYYVSLFALLSTGVFLLTKVIIKKRNNTNKEHI
jgi:hypothetical protein